jgi:hypothetical protein
MGNITLQDIANLFAGAVGNNHDIFSEIEYGNGRQTALFDHHIVYSNAEMLEMVRTSHQSLVQPPPSDKFVEGYNATAAECGIPSWDQRYKLPSATPFFGTA